MSNGEYIEQWSDRVYACVHFEHVCNGDHRSNEERKSPFSFNVYLRIRMWTNNELLIKSYDGRNEWTMCMSTSSSSERLASMCICTEKKSKESSLLRIVFAHAEENRHALVYENVYTLSLSLSLLLLQHHANRSRCTDHKKKKRKEEKK